MPGRTNIHLWLCVDEEFLFSVKLDEIVSFKITMNKNKIWADGSYFERSLRYFKNKNESNFKEVENHAVTISLLHTEDTWELLNKSIYHNLTPRRIKVLDKNADQHLKQQMGFSVPEDEKRW